MMYKVLSTEPCSNRPSTKTVSTVFSSGHLARGLIPKKIILIPTIKPVLQENVNICVDFYSHV